MIFLATIFTLAAPPADISFRNDIVPILAKQGCSGAACHGAPSGKGGFKLSLAGYDPEADYPTLTRDLLGRRVNSVSPEASLIFVKGLAQVPHQGGQRLRVSEPSYDTLRAWIAAGCPNDLAVAPRCVSIEVTPAAGGIHKLPAKPISLRVVARFDNGETRDVTALATYAVSDEQTLQIGHDGVVAGRKRGNGMAFVRYHEHTKVIPFTFIEEMPGFVWSNPPAVNYVDQLVDAQLKQFGINPSERCNDGEFLRRVYLDVIGILPSVEEARTFLDDPVPDKRTRVIDELLARKEHPRFWAQRWGDQFQITAARMGKTGSVAFHGWIEKALADNMPYDRFARELLTATGNIKDNPAASFYRMGDDLNENMEAAAILFMGSQIQCAKCHNHPEDRWTRINYHALSNFFHRIERKLADPKNPKANDDLMIVLGPAKEVKIPDTTKVIAAWLPGAGPIELTPKTDPREQFAGWLTKPDNPFFARTQANRVWSWLMGKGIVDPSDDLRETNPPSNPGLLEALTKDFVEHKFDTRHLVRTILLSRTYQSSYRTNASNRDDDRYFSHYQPRRLSAEQLLDAVSLTTGVPEAFKSTTNVNFATQLPAPDLAEHDFLRNFGQPARAATCNCERPRDPSLGAALAMFNGKVVQDKLKSANNRIAAAMRSKKSSEAIIEELYLAAYCRKPTDSERAVALKHLQGKSDPTIALQDLCWALMNTNEFFYQH